MHVTMAGISPDVGAVPLDLSIKQPSVGTAPPAQGPQVPKTLENNESDSKALDLTRSSGTVSFHRAIPVTTTVPSTTEIKKFEKSQYVQSPNAEDGKENVCHVSPVVTSGSKEQVSSYAHSSSGFTPIRPKYVSPTRTKDELTRTVGQTRLSPSTLTLQQQSAMGNFAAMDTSEPHIPQRPASVGAPTVIVQNSLSTGYIITPGRVPPETTRPIPEISLKPGTRIILSNSELQRLNSVKSERIAGREDDEPPPMKAKALEGRGRGVVPLHHFQPYPHPRPPTCIHRSLSIPSHSGPGRSISPRMPLGTEGAVSPAIVVPGMQMSLNRHHVTVLPGSSGLTPTPSGTTNSSVALTYSVLGTPQVASSQSKESGSKGEPVMSSKAEASKTSQTPQMKESLQSFTSVSAASSKSDATNQGTLPINPFYPLSVAVDCHRATAQDSDGDTPLHIAIVQEQPDLAYVQRLIQLVKMSGKSLDIFNYMQQTPLHLAAITNNIEVIRIMLEAGANPNEADRNGLTTVHHACCNRNSPCMAVIFKYSTFDIDLEKRNFNGHTPLHVAVEKGDKVLVRMLLEHKANVNAMDSRNGWTPLFISVANKDIKMLGILVEFGAKVNAQSYSGNSALHIATGRGYTDVVKVLVQYGADLSLKNSHWDTPVNVANANEMSQLLRGICRGSPSLSTSPSQAFARESSTSPVNHPYHGSYSPPPTSSKPHNSFTTSHDNVRSALSNKIHRKLSRDSLTPSSPVDKGRESPIGRRKIKSTKVVSVPVDGDSFRLGQLVPMTEGNKIPVITKSGAPTQDSAATVLSNDSGIGSWRADSNPSIDKSTVSFEPVKQEKPVISEQVVSSSDGIAASEETMEFTVQTKKSVLSEGANVKVEKVSSIPMTSATSEAYESMEVDIDPIQSQERIAGIKGPRSIAPRPVVPSVNVPFQMKTIDGGTIGLTHMFGLPMSTGSEVKGRASVEVKSVASPKVQSQGFDTTAVPVYRKAMQNGQQMSKSKVKVSPVHSPVPVAKPSTVGSSTARQSSVDSDDEGKLVIVEKMEMRTKPLKKTVSRSCPSSPSMVAKMPEKTESPTPERPMET